MSAMAGTAPEPDEPRPRIVLITHPVDGADEFARLLVEERIAACVQRAPVRSVYRWQGAVQDDDEVLLVAKVTDQRWTDLQALLAARHPYEVPECIALEPQEVAGAYLAWWRAETRAGR